MFVLTEKQLSKCSLAPSEMPSDGWFKVRAKKERKPWGILKRNYALEMLKSDPEYQRGLGQGRVDKARGLPYSEERSESAYNLGYYRGYTDYESDRRGWDQSTRQRFDEQYGKGEPA